MIKHVRSINNTLHIALFNYDNSFCHHIAVMQRLHSSPTLNHLCQTLHDVDDEYVRDLIKPVQIYSTYTGEDGQDLAIYTALKEYYTYFVNKYVSSVGMYGYIPMNVLVYIMLPVIYDLFPSDFETIISELHMDKIDFNNIDYVIKDIIFSSNAFLRTKYQQKQYQLYSAMIEKIPDHIEKQHFVSAIFEVYPNKNKTGGHAITLLKGIDEQYYIIDDQNAISKLEDYYSLRESRLYAISVKDIDEVTIANINAILHAKCIISPECAFSKRVSRYELNFEEKFSNVNEASLLTHSNDNNELNMLLLFISGVIVGVIVGIVVAMIVKHMNSEYAMMNM